jgi:hypothetical protein
MNIQDITNHIDFQLFMESIWEIRTRPAGPGVELGQHPQYRIYHNALTVAKLIGLRRTGGSTINGMTAHVYRFPGIDNQSVVIAGDGASLKVSVRRFTTRA